MDNQTKGKYGEDLAVSHLEAQGFEILERNYRYGRGEVDIIALYGNVLLVFVEVKIRKNNTYGEPESFVSKNQEKRIIAAADHYIQCIHWRKDIRFDIIAIDGKGLEHFEDAFY